MRDSWYHVNRSLLAPPRFPAKATAQERCAESYHTLEGRDGQCLCGVFPLSRPGLVDLATAVLVPLSMALWSLFILGV